MFFWPLASFFSYMGMFKMLSVVGAAIGGLLFIALYRFQSSLIYPASLNDSRAYCAKPDEYDMPDYEELYLKTDDGEAIQCYVLKHDPQSSGYTNKTVLVLLPNAGNIGHALPIVSLFHVDFGYNVVIYSYRGYGKSTGLPLETGLKLDAKRIMQHIMTDDAQLSASSLVMYGRSLGGAVGIHIAAQYPDAVLGLILENTFLSIPKTVPHIFPMLRYVTRFVHQKWESEAVVPAIPSHIPALLLSGGRDEIVPPDHMERIYELLPCTDKTILRYELSCHNNMVLQPGYWESIHQFIREKVNPVGL